jgi:hypothetical protein
MRMLIASTELKRSADRSPARWALGDADLADTVPAELQAIVPLACGAVCAARRAVPRLRG